MKRNKALFAWVAVLFLTAAASATAAIGKVEWSDQNCWIYNHEIRGCKSGDRWDTQKTDQAMNPLKFVLHKMESNPVIWLQLSDAVSGTDPARYAGDVRVRYEARGIKVNAVQKQQIDGKDVYIVSGLDEAKGVRYSVALFPRLGTKRAYHLEYTASVKDFSTYEPDFMAMVQTIRVM